MKRRSLSALALLLSFGVATPLAHASNAVERAFEVARDATLTLDGARELIAAERSAELLEIVLECMAIGACHGPLSDVSMAEGQELDLIVDGHFEDPHQTWHVHGDVTHVSDGSGGHMVLQAEDGIASWIAQRVRIPYNAYQSRLGISWSAEEPDTLASHSLDVYVVTDDDARLLRSLRPMPYRASGREHIDMSDYAGRDITLVFRAVGAASHPPAAYSLFDVGLAVRADSEPLPFEVARIDYVATGDMFELALFEDALGASVVGGFDPVPGYSVFGLGRGLEGELAGSQGPGWAGPIGIDLDSFGNSAGGAPWDASSDFDAWAGTAGGALANGVLDPSGWRGTATDIPSPTYTTCYFNNGATTVDREWSSSGVLVRETVIEVTPSGWVVTETTTWDMYGRKVVRTKWTPPQCAGGNSGGSGTCSATGGAGGSGGSGGSSGTGGTGGTGGSGGSGGNSGTGGSGGSGGSGGTGGTGGTGGSSGTGGTGGAGGSGGSGGSNGTGGSGGSGGSGASGGSGGSTGSGGSGSGGSCSSSGTSDDTDDGDDSGRHPLNYRLRALAVGDGARAELELIFPEGGGFTDPAPAGTLLGYFGSIEISTVTSEIATTTADDPSSEPKPFSKPQLVPPNGLLVIDPISIRIEQDL